MPQVKLRTDGGADLQSALMVNTGVGAGLPDDFSSSQHSYLAYYRHTSSQDANDMQDGWHDIRTAVSNCATEDNGTLIQNSYNGSPFQIWIPDVDTYVYKRYNNKTEGLTGVAWSKFSAGSADSVQWTGVVGRPTGVSEFVNDAGYLTAAITSLTIAATGSGNAVGSMSVSGNKITYNKDVNALTAETQLTTAATGSGNVVSGITVSNHQITINKGINALTAETQLSTASTGSGNVISGITVSNHKITVDKGITALTAETQLSTASTGSGNVVSSIDVNNHKITINKGISALTAITTAASGSGNVISDITVSGNQITKVKGITALTAETQLSTAASGTGNVVSDITVSGHQITKVKGITALTAETQLTTAATGSGNVVSGITVDKHKITVNKGITALTAETTLTTAAGTTGGNVISSIDVSNHKITINKGVTALTAITTAATGSGNVISDITVSGNQITKVKGITALTAHSPIATTTLAGLVSTGTQSFAGNKTVSGTVSATSFIATSSRKVKKDIEPTLVSAVDLINTVDIVDFKFINDDEERPHIGFIAEDTDPILSTPHLNSMDYTNCIGVLMKAVQELSEEIKELKKGNR